LKQARSVPQVFQHGVREGTGSYIANLFLHHLDSPHFQRHDTTRIVRLHACGDLFIDDQSERGTDLFVEVAVNAIPVDEVAPKAEHAMHQRHG